MTKGTKAVVIAIVAVVAGLGVGWLVLQLASSGQANIRLGEDEFNAGYTEVLARAIDDGDGQPLIFNDVSALEAAGVAAVFSPGTSIDTITDWLTTALEARERNMEAHA